MKNLIILFIFIFFSCNTTPPATQKTATEEQQRDALTGAWRMINYLRITSDGDSITDDRRQYKVYVDGSVMWGFEAAPDSTEWFGYGSYFIEGDSLFESMVSGSNAFREAIKEQNNFYRIGLTISDEGYTQVIKDDLGLTYESYVRVKN